jgi:hypothetical protein
MEIPTSPLSFPEDDPPTTRPVAVINEAFARRFFKNENPLGKHFGPDKIQYASRYEIVGVVKDMRYMTYDYRYNLGFHTIPKDLPGPFRNNPASWGGPPVWGSLCEWRNSQNAENKARLVPPTSLLSHLDR